MRSCSSTSVYRSPICFSIGICSSRSSNGAPKAMYLVFSEVEDEGVRIMHSKLMSVVASAGMLLAAAVSVSAHHSFSAEFDQNRQVTLEGKVVMMEWVNPHSWLHIDVTKADGTVERWKLEGGSPSVLLR